MKKEPLFRQEVINSKRNQNYGSVFINAPIRYKVLAIALAVICVLLILFIACAEFSEKFIVTGYLNSTKGIARVYASKSGVIVASHVEQGMAVHQGDELFVVDTALQGVVGSTQQNMLDGLRHRQQKIGQEIRYRRNQLVSLKPLLEKRYISMSSYHEKQEEIVALENSRSLVDMEIIKHNQDNAYVVHSPIDGVISTVNYQSGQYVNTVKPLVKILPAGADLTAELFIPVKQSGFLSSGNRIILRYDAYPYERFGSYGAVIKSISQTVLTDEEDDKPIPLNQPYYKVSAQLDSQFVHLYGQSKALQHGMTVTAVMIGSKRKIWQWILDPLYSFYGELFV